LEYHGKFTGLGAVRVFEAVKNNCPGARVYQASSSEMFGGVNREEYFDENARFHPRSPYGVAKCTAHYMAKVYCESYGMFISCGILFNHTGEYRGKEFVERKITDGVARIKLGLQDKISLGNLDSFRDFGSAEKYVEAMWLMLQQDKCDNYVIATGKSHSIKDILRYSLRAVNLEFNLKKFVVFDSQFARCADIVHLLGCSTKAQNILGWKYDISFEEIITKMVIKDVERVTKEKMF
jgi:GDPmannose 4,6-dehydratase